MAGTTLYGRAAGHGDTVTRRHGEGKTGSVSEYRGTGVSGINPKPETRNLLIPPLDLRVSME